jgi:hypothetical protein
LKKAWKMFYSSFINSKQIFIKNKKGAITKWNKRF